MVRYASADDVRAQAKSYTPGDEPLIELFLDAAADAIDAYCNRDDGFIAALSGSARTFAGQGEPYLLIDECVEVVSVAMKRALTDTAYTALAPTDWLPFAGSPEQPDFNSKPYSWLLTLPSGNFSIFTSGRYGVSNGFRIFDESRVLHRKVPTVEVTAKWGYSVAAPERVRQASIIMATRWLQRGRAGWADTIQMANQGNLMYVKVLDPDVQLLLSEGRLVLPAI